MKSQFDSVSENPFYGRGWKATPNETHVSTFGPGFPVGPLAPLEPRGPCV